jgi:hypothetical protein
LGNKKNREAQSRRENKKYPTYACVRKRRSEIYANAKNFVLFVGDKKRSRPEKIKDIPLLYA